VWQYFPKIQKINNFHAKPPILCMWRDMLPSSRGKIIQHSDFLGRGIGKERINQMGTDEPRSPGDQISLRAASRHNPVINIDWRASVNDFVYLESYGHEPVGATFPIPASAPPVCRPRWTPLPPSAGDAKAMVAPRQSRRPGFKCPLDFERQLN
jgi:hypothetical protein